MFEIVWIQDLFEKICSGLPTASSRTSQEPNRNSSSSSERPVSAREPTPNSSGKISTTTTSQLVIKSEKSSRAPSAADLTKPSLKPSEALSKQEDSSVTKLLSRSSMKK